MYKNLKAICEIPDAHMMWALVLLDLESDLGQRIVKQLPEYFIGEKQVGPYPLSFMWEEARKNARRDGCGCDGKDIVSHDGVFLADIPVETFDVPEKGKVVQDGNWLPDEIDPYASPGEIVVWAGKRFIVLENHRGGWLSIAPAELVHVDCLL